MTEQLNPYESSQRPTSSEQRSSRPTWTALAAIPSGLILCLFSGWYRMEKVGVVTLASGSPEREKQIGYESSADFMFYVGITLLVFGFGYFAFLLIHKKFRG